MNQSTLAFLLVIGSALLVSAEISSHQDLNKVEARTDKDLKDAKERWIPNEDEDIWDDDMMQHPIDEGPRRVSALSMKPFGGHLAIALGCLHSLDSSSAPDDRPRQMCRSVRAGRENREHSMLSSADMCSA